VHAGFQEKPPMPDASVLARWHLLCKCLKFGM
jgi:hypothetical protein